VKRIHKISIVIVLLLGIGILGAIFFFPMNINNQYTCLYHRLFSPDHSYAHAYDNIVQHYIASFGFLWWGSLTLIAVSIYALKRLVKIRNGNSQTNQSTINSSIET